MAGETFTVETVKPSLFSRSKYSLISQFPAALASAPADHSFEIFRGLALGDQNAGVLGRKRAIAHEAGFVLRAAFLQNGISDGSNSSGNGQRAVDAKLLSAPIRLGVALIETHGTTGEVVRCSCSLQTEILRPFDLGYVT